ncbi:PREDICTED: zinc finger CCCH domain-containing protein 45-like [Tarenaya hassleriana]|uniref:zinc finger CCCH domain-containing protein 45-like n=1 Tax=Tarenaya hassleriana TaxID=28532 RepID=UPI00053C6076|nr:PREDICTED: zinc finger CCCH domain-containing protein 45-like [Tarenaya hassleriana]
MAAVASSDSIISASPLTETAYLLHNLSLDPEAKPEAPNAGNKDVCGGSGNGFLLPSEQVSLPAETTKTCRPGLSPNKGSNLKKLGYKNSSFNPKGTYPAGLYTPPYQYPRYGYGGSFSCGKTSSLYHYPYLTRSMGMARSFGHMDNMYSYHGMYGPYMNGLEAGYGYGPYGYETWRQPNSYAYNNGYQTSGHGLYGKENNDGLNELNKGPRAKGFTNQEGSLPKTLACSNEQNMSVPDREDYNKGDFPETYLHAKFYVIKSYSEDDIHRSIKYNVWSSTANGNKKLDAAYNEAKEKSDACPVFLLFSVNTSGQFVGLAEMVGPVDFNKTVEYWQQDRWVGCFPVKWHVVKDIPNSAFRHITLENNENKPVTNSRDTQEVDLDHGVEIIKIFKDHSSKTSIFDDFEFYDARQKVIQDRKAKHQQFKKQALSSTDNNGRKETSSTDELPKTKDTTGSEKAEQEVMNEANRKREQAKEKDIASSDVAGS